MKLKHPPVVLSVLEIDNKNITTQFKYAISEVIFEDDIDKATMVTMKIDNHNNKFIDHKLFQEGREIHLYAGYSPITKYPPVNPEFVGPLQPISPWFTGKIISVEPSWGEGNDMFVLRAYDKSFSLKGEKSSEVLGFPQENPLTKSSPKSFTLSTLAKGFAKKKGIQVRPDNIMETKTIFKSLPKKSETIWSFLKRNLRKYGYDIWVDRNYLYIWKMSDLLMEKARAVIKYKKNTISFTPRLTIAGIPTKVHVRGFDENGKAKIVTFDSLKFKRKMSKLYLERVGLKSGLTVIAEQRGEISSIINQPDLSVKEAEEQALAFLQIKNLDLIVGTIKIEGRESIRARDIVSLEGFSNRFDGDYFVTKSRHTLWGKYETELTVKRAVRPDTRKNYTQVMKVI